MAIWVAYSQRHMQRHSVQVFRHLPDRIVLRMTVCPVAETLPCFWLPYVHTRQGFASTEEPAKVDK